MSSPGQTPTPNPQSPAGAQAPAGAAASGQPPIGSSPATQPVPNRGLQAQGLAKLSIVVRQLEQLLPVFGAGSEAGRAILDSLNKLSKHVQPGSISSGLEQSALSELQNKLRQNAAMQAAGKAAAPASQGPAPQSNMPMPPQALQQLMQQKPAGSA